MPSPSFSRPVLIAGLPRSGTTWTGRVLGATGATYVHEPDNHLVLPEAWVAKEGFGPFPDLRPGEDAPNYEQLFGAAFAGGNRPSLRYSSARLVHRATPRAGRGALLWLTGPLAAARHERPDPPERVVVKSVFCARSLEWLADRFAPTVVVVTRHPFSVISSWAALGWDDFLDDDPRAVDDSAIRFGVVPPPEAGWIDRAAWHYGYLDAVLREALERHPEWMVVRHDVLCSDPPAQFAKLAEALGLGWNEAATEFLLASNRRGRGYSTNRVWSEEVDGWQTRLDPDDQDRVMGVLARFGQARARARARGIR
jgi:hypothetical protein